MAEINIATVKNWSHFIIEVFLSRLCEFAKSVAFTSSKPKCKYTTKSEWTLRKACIITRIQTFLSLCRCFFFYFTNFRAQLHTILVTLTCLLIITENGVTLKYWILKLSNHFSLKSTVYATEFVGSAENSCKYKYHRKGRESRGPVILFNVYIFGFAWSAGIRVWKGGGGGLLIPHSRSFPKNTLKKTNFCKSNRFKM